MSFFSKPTRNHPRCMDLPARSNLSQYWRQEKSIFWRSFSNPQPPFDLHKRSLFSSTIMATKYVLGSMVAATVVAFSLDYLIADKKIFGGTTPKTVASNEWWKKPKRSFRHGLELLDHQL
ncbi:hypothetical protein AAC387_Pa02g4314 [Persea americana]